MKILQYSDTAWTDKHINQVIKLSFIYYMKKASISARINLDIILLECQSSYQIPNCYLSLSWVAVCAWLTIVCEK